MAIKSIEREQGCFAKAAEDEPLFVLRAQDTLAIDTVQYWILRARALGVSEDKIKEAEGLRRQMGRWAEEHGVKKPD